TDGDGLDDRAEVAVGTDPTTSDTDGDGLDDALDACPLDPANDVDGDGWCAEVDNCPLDASVSRADADQDGYGDACDLCLGWDDSGDVDGDGLCGDVDVCPYQANPLQADADGDGTGNACDVCPGPSDGLVPFGLGGGVIIDDCLGLGDEGCTYTWEGPARGFDPDGDGDMDVLQLTNAGAMWYENRYPAAFRLRRVENATFGWLQSDVGDVDGDGDEDVLLGGRQLGLALNDGSGTFTTVVLPAAVATSAVRLVDVDGDGDLDAIAAVDGGPVLWAENTGALQPPALVAALRDVTGIEPADVDGDGDEDLILSRADGVWWVERGVGGFAAPIRWLATPDVVSVHTWDDDGDGELDLLVGSAEGLLHLRGTGPATFDAPTLLHPDPVEQLVVDDLNGDGARDVVVTTPDPAPYRTSTKSALLGRAGGFTLPIPFGLGTDTSALVDIDGDGYLDDLASAYAWLGWRRAVGSCVFADSDGGGWLDGEELLTFGTDPSDPFDDAP
ncbi:MAG: VCBS repeat-containing protein, partial [Myxococcales bacterium]|nr:VCBS repeat-containing protein [Myxococcales bacterium]